MSKSAILDATTTITAGTPTYDDLIDLYNELREFSPESREMMVAKYAIAEVLGEFIDYLDLVMDEFEKSIGLTMQDERLRVLEALAGPTSDDPVEMAADIVGRWQSVDLVSPEDIYASFG